MRKFVTAAATALTLVLGLASPAMADHRDNGGNYPYPNQGGYQQQGGYQDEYFDPRYQQPNDDYRYPQNGQYDRRYYDRYDFGRYNGNFDRWERGWGYDRRYQDQYRYQRPMSLKKIIRALAYQGFYGVRNLQRSRWGSDYRAFAFDRSGRPVMLRVNAFNGRVSDVRYI